MRPLLLALTMLAPTAVLAADDWATSFPADRVASYLPQDGKRVAIAPAGERSAELSAAAAALQRALTGSEVCAHSDDLDDALVVKHCAIKADFFFVVRVFPPSAVVTLLSLKLSPLGAFSATRGRPIDAQTTSASSQGVSQDARESVLSVVKKPNERRAPPSSAPGEPQAPPAPSQANEPRVRRWQFGFAPVIPALGGFVVTLGSSLRASVELAGGFGVTVSGGVNWLRLPGEFVTELPSSELLATDAGGTFGVQYAPALGRLRPLLRVGLLLVGGSHLLKPPTASSPATWAATGLRAGLAASAGASFEITPAFRVVLELQYQLLPSDVSSVAGCNVDDLRALDLALRSGRDPAGAVVGSSCTKARFTGVDENGNKRSNDVPLALNLVRSPAGTIAHRFAPMLGFELAF